MELRRVVPDDRGTNALICENLQKQAVANAPVENMNPGNAVFHGIDTALQLRNHAAAHRAVLNQLARLASMQLRNQR